MRQYLRGLPLYFTLCACAASGPATAVSEDLTPAEQSEFDAATLTADCYCQHYLGLDKCDSLPPGSTRGALPALGSFGGLHTNGCVEAYDPIGLSSEVIRPGFCRSDYNYCMASELRLRADSFARAPSSRAVRDALLDEARAKFESSSVESASSISFLDELCGPTESELYTMFNAALDTSPTLRAQATYHECTRLRPGPMISGYEPVAIRRMSDSVAQIADVLMARAQSATAVSDSVALGSERGPSLGANLWGDTSARMAAASVIMGSGDPNTLERSGAAPIPARWRDSYQAQSALALMIAHGVPVTYRECTPQGVSGWSRMRLWDTVDVFASNVDFDYGAAAFNYLDHRIAAAQYQAPFGTTIEGAELRQRQPLADLVEFKTFESRALAPSLSPLRRVHGLRPEHIREAAELLADLATTMELDYTATALFSFPADVQGVPSTCSVNSLEVHSDLAAQREPAYLARLLALPQSDNVTIAGAGASEAITRIVRPDDTLRPLDRFSGTLDNGEIRRFNERNWYHFNPEFLAERGAAGALHMLRSYLLRVRDAPVSGRDTAALDAAIALATGYVGDVWTERTPDTWPECSPAPSCPPGASLDRCRCMKVDVVVGAADLWSIYFDPENHSEYTSGRFLMVREEGDVFCLEHGHRVDSAPGTGCDFADGTAWHPTQMVERVAASSALQIVSEPDWHGFHRRTYLVPDVLGPTPEPTHSSRAYEPRYVVWESPAGPDGRHSYRLVDVITTFRTAEVHAMGGEFGEMFATIGARDATNPMAPALTSLGLPYDLIPPLENELIDDSDGFEDSWDRYLTQATRAADRATAMLALARDHEIEMIRNDRATAATFDLAALAQQEVIAEQCGALGTDGSCTGEHVSDVALTDLVTIVPRAGSLEPVVDPSGTRVVSQAQDVVVSGGELHLNFRLHGAAHVQSGSVEIRLTGDVHELVLTDAARDGRLILQAPHPRAGLDLGTIDYDTGVVRIGLAESLDGGTPVLASYTPYRYDPRWSEVFLATFGSARVPGPISCSEFMDNAVELFNIPQISTCHENSEAETLTSTILGGTSASNAFCRLADEDTDEIGRALVCALFPFPSGLFDDLCAAERRAGYRGRLGHYLRGYLGDAIRCADWQVRTTLQEATIDQMPEAVVSSFRSGEEPVYADAGGLVRQEYIAMHQSLIDMEESVRAFERERDMAVQRAEYAALYTDYTASDATEQTLCMTGNILQTIGSMWGGFQGGGSGGGALSSMGSGFENASQTRRGCTEGDVTAFSSGFSAFFDVMNSTEAMRSSAIRARTLVAEVASADGRLDTIERRVEIATQRRAITERLATSAAVAGDPSWRALQGLEGTRARSALRRAQQQAFVARRAIEFRLATDTRTMTVNEPFVEAPAGWVNDVFVLDTETIEGSSGPFWPGETSSVLVAGEAIEDHVLNLQDFVSGYPFARRFSEGEDVAILSLASLAASVDAAVCEGTCGFDSESRLYRCVDEPSAWRPGGFVVTYDAEGRPVCPATIPEPCGGIANVVEVAECSRDSEPPRFVDRLLFKCTGSDVVLLGGVPIGTEPEVPPCGDHDADGIDQLGSVEYAVHGFRIPEPAASYLSDRLAIENYNYRIESVALNLAGSSTVDCSRAASPTECYADGNLQYTLHQSSMVALESYEGEQLSYFMEPGRIEHARALAAERYLTNPLSSADRALLSDYSRAEWWGRPLAGVYTIVLHARPEVVWENIEDIQVLLTYDYWTRQE